MMMDSSLLLGGSKVMTSYFALCVMVISHSCSSNLNVHVSLFHDVRFGSSHFYFHGCRADHNIRWCEHGPCSY